MKFFWCLTIVVLASAYLASARNVNRANVDTESFGRSHKQARVFPGAVAIKKLVLLKFKKIVPISLILLKSSNENEAELVPVYPTSEIPSDVQFIPTPNGISGHKDVQAIAVPNEFHQQLELHGLTNLEGIESLLNQAEQNENGESTLTVAEPTEKEDELLNLKEEDEDQLLENASADKPAKKSGNSTRRLSLENAKSSLKTQTSVEEIPIYLYSTNDNAHVIKHQIGARRYQKS
ncbi:uncharacterized protein LOC111677512 [Lucilia cuprina]|uniref:uncharacterized protein LOC111677512 n=1 Tax=Lucilia cuprina TaxID=7375 RepID=UPI001F052CBC|nr:uncharacterized protein LOC111677512 [Lucilia cuprina]